MLYSLQNIGLLDIGQVLSNDHALIEFTWTEIDKIIYSSEIKQLLCTNNIKNNNSAFALYTARQSLFLYYFKFNSLKLNKTLNEK